MPYAQLWHFACHGVADLEHPLESAVILTDGPLTLREILGRPAGEHRLAVLSACETDIPDLNLVDEALSLSGGMLRAGVAGVVASQWEVDDEAAALLMLRFHTLFRGGMPPGRALVTAQAWLRAATYGELHHTYPDVVYEPVGLTQSALEAWHRSQPFKHPHYWAAFTFTGA
jgi:CHAT domain-containing protein